MSASVFDDKAKQPASLELDEVSGATAALLKEIEQHLLAEFGEVTREWKFYGKKAGWTLAIAHKKRRVFHLIPQPGFFTVVFTLGKQAVLAAQHSGLPEEILSAIADAREYAEGRSIRLDIATPDDVAVVKQLIALKMAG